LNQTLQGALIAAWCTAPGLQVRVNHTPRRQIPSTPIPYHGVVVMNRLGQGQQGVDLAWIITIEMGYML